MEYYYESLAHHTIPTAIRPQFFRIIILKKILTGMMVKMMIIILISSPTSSTASSSSPSSTRPPPPPSQSPPPLIPLRDLLNGERLWTPYASSITIIHINGAVAPLF